VHQGGVSVYVKIVDLISLRHQLSIWNIREKKIETDGRELNPKVGSALMKDKSKDTYVKQEITGLN
jgi:hypothetical protein